MQWFTADLHLGHARIIELSDRPFADVDDMNRELVWRWNDRVGEDDVVWVLGDFALGKIDDTLPVVSRLRGRKILLSGNHDRTFAGTDKAILAWRDRYLDAGFCRVYAGYPMRIPLIGYGRVQVCHFPEAGESQDREDRYSDFRPKLEPGEWLVHGHVHERWQVNGRQINVGVDANGFAPVSATEIIRIITRGAE